MRHISKVTPKEKRFLEVYGWAKKTYGRKPTYSELAKNLGYRSLNSIRQFMLSLHRKGIGLNSYKQNSHVNKEIKSTFLVPILGAVPCGTPFLAQQNWEGQIPVDSNLLKGNPNEYFFLKAVGKSMDLAGIDDGDYVLFRSQPTADPGEKVVALIGDDATIKFFRPNKDYIALIPKSSDPSYKPIIVSEDLKVQGVVKYVVKKEIIEGSEKNGKSY